MAEPLGGGARGGGGGMLRSGAACGMAVGLLPLLEGWLLVWGGGRGSQVSASVELVPGSWYLTPDPWVLFEVSLEEEGRSSREREAKWVDSVEMEVMGEELGILAAMEPMRDESRFILSMVRSRLMSLRNGHLVMPRLRQTFLREVRDMSRSRAASFCGCWKNSLSRSKVILVDMFSKQA